MSGFSSDWFKQAITMNIKLLIIQLLAFIMISCSQVIDYSPYDADINHRDVNTENIKKIKDESRDVDSLIFIAISDTHTKYNDLKSAINFINKLDDVSFVIVCGDITNLGLYKEFDDYYHIMSRLKMPFITAIGNHDYLSNGKLIYEKMFGPTNFYFDIGNYRMVVFDNVVWENGNQEPDFEWFQQTLNIPEGMTSIACYHIHRFDPQLENGYADKMLGIIEKYPVSLSIFGHGHDYWEEEVNNRRYLMVPDITMRNMTKITLANKTATIQILSF